MLKKTFPLIRDRCDKLSFSSPHSCERSYIIVIATVSLIIFALLSQNALAIGIVSPEQTSLVFEPYLHHSDTFMVRNNGNETMKINLYAGGDLSRYVTLSTASDTLAPFELKRFSYNLDLPGEIPPGKYAIAIGAVEAPPEGGGIVAVTAAEMKIFVDVPYPPRFIKADLNVAEENEAYSIAASVSSLGNESVDVSGALAVYDCWNNSVKTTDISRISIRAGGTEKFYIKLEKKDFEAGAYRAAVKINYDGKTLAAEKEFSIGAPSVEVGEISGRILRRGENGNLKIHIKNLYNGKTKDVYAAVFMLDKKIETPKTDLAAKENRTLEVPIETKDFQYGVYKTDVRVFQGDKTAAQQSISVYVIPKNIEAHALFAFTAIMFIAAGAHMMSGSLRKPRLLRRGAPRASKKPPSKPRTLVRGDTGFFDNIQARPGEGAAS